MSKNEMICILCPLGCKMNVQKKPDQPGELSVRGHQCKEGRVYAYEEYNNPTRTLTSTVVINGVSLPRLPVKTSKPIPISLIYDAVEEISKVAVNGPVETGAVIIENLLGTGTDVIATRSMS